MPQILLQSLSLALLWAACCCSAAWAQASAPAGGPQVLQVDGKTVIATPAMPEGQPVPPPGEDQPTPGDEQPKVKPPDAAAKTPAEAKPTVLERPKEPPEPADPRELDVRPGPDGQLRFSFRGQAWLDVLDWLATVSGMSLDWQQLPADYLNLITQRSYSLEEARDLINRHLLARGFTMLINGEVLSVVKLENIDPGLVPRVDPEQLSDLPPHQYVKVSLPLEWMIAETAVAELKPMLSPHGKLVALKSTNRLEVMDAAANVRELHAVLLAEQSTGSQDRLVREFVLQYTRAEEVRSQLLGLLGIQDRKRAAAPAGGPQQQMEMMQQQAQMMAQMQQQQQQQQGQPGGGGARPRRAEDEVFLVVNVRRNSILAHAPPDTLAMLAKAVETIDVPTERDRSLLLNMNRMQIYRLASLDPEALIKTLQEVGDLEPATRLEADTKNKAVIAYASLVDHLTIRSVVDKLDGTGRRFEVLRLRSLAADYVAGTIEFMMGQKEQPTEQRPRYFGFFGSSQPEQEQDKDRLRVDADVEGNRLLLWANDVELDEVRNLLVKLGEIPAEGGLDTIRVIDLEPGTAGELLERLRQNWPAISPNPLELPPLPAPGASPPLQPAAPERPPEGTPLDTRAAEAPRARFAVRFAQLSADPPAQPPRPSDPPGGLPPDSTPPPQQRVQPGEASPPAQLPPVQLTIGADGRLVITSDDPQALRLMEDLVNRLAEPRRDYRQFPLRYASAFWVRLNLEDFFKDEKEDANSRRRTYYFYDAPPPQEKEKRYRLSQRRPLKFIDDTDTNSVLVVGADAEQMSIIEDLVQMWDVPPPTDSASARLISVFQIRYSKASLISETIKEVYRDLLSANDKSLQQGGPQDKRPTNQTTYILGEPTNAEPDRRTQVSFKGKLSLGVDEVSNTLLVSTEGQALMDSVGKMIEALDEAAKPAADVRVLTLRGDLNSREVRAMLQGILGEAAAGAKPSGPGAAALVPGGQAAAPGQPATPAGPPR